MRVSEILSQKPVSGVETVGRRETLTALAQRLAEKKIGALVVVDEAGAMVGVISERDVVSAVGAEGGPALNDAVEKHMTAKVVTAAPDDTTESVLERMTHGRFRHMPVIDGDALVGVVSIGDIVKARIELLTREKNAMEEFIRG